MEDLDKLGHPEQPMEQLPPEAEAPAIKTSKAALSSEPAPAPKPIKKVDDGGYWSRKFTLSVGMAIASIGLAVAATVWPQFSALFDELTNTLMGILAIYVGGNTATKWVSTRKKK